MYNIGILIHRKQISYLNFILMIEAHKFPKNLAPNFAFFPPYQKGEDRKACFFLFLNNDLDNKEAFCGGNINKQIWVLNLITSSFPVPLITLLVYATSCLGTRWKEKNEPLTSIPVWNWTRERQPPFRRSRCARWDAMKEENLRRCENKNEQIFKKVEKSVEFAVRKIIICSLMRTSRWQGNFVMM